MFSFLTPLSNLTPMVQLFVEHASNFCFKITVLNTFLFSSYMSEVDRKKRISK